ncbi:MAG: YgaP family membrane protein [Gemmatimonadaceae bacterium]
MHTNLGSADRTIRLLFGAALLLLVVSGPKTLWGLLGLVPLLTGAAGYCPLYAVLGFSTKRGAHA